MRLSEDIRKEIWQMASDPESVCYIEKHDGEGFKVEEIDGDYCHLCATEKARELDKEDGGKYYHQVYEETSPEDDHFRYCEECGCLLNAALIVRSWNEDDFNYIVDDLKRAKTFDDIKGDLAWMIDQVLDSEDEACELFPKQMKYIARRLTNLYKKQTRLTGGAAVGKHQTADWLFAMRCMIKDAAEHGNIYLEIKTKEFKKIIGNNNRLACFCVLRADGFIVHEFTDFIIIYWG